MAAKQNTKTNTKTWLAVAFGTALFGAVAQPAAALDISKHGNDSAEAPAVRAIQK